MTAERIEAIQQALESAFSPLHIQVKDQSHLHAGHAGAREGKGHFRVVIVSEAFDGLPMLKRHRLVYQALGDMMETDIHALMIEANAPD